MSGLDDLTRFYCTFNPSLVRNEAWYSQAEFRDGIWYSYNPLTGAFDAPNNYDDYPHPSSGQSSSSYTSDVDGVFGGRGFRVFSYEPALSPVRTMSYWWVEERTSIFAPSGLFALFGNDYTIDFWIKVNPDASGHQPIMGNASGWEIYYEDGVIHQNQSSTHHVSCACDLTGSFHHVEFNRSSGVNRILIDGVPKTLIVNLWNPQGINLYGFYIGCTDSTYRNVDYVIDEVLFSTGIARHIADFTLMTEEYSRIPWKSFINLFIQEEGTGDVYSGYLDTSTPIPVELPTTDISVANNTLTKIGHGLSNGNIVYLNASSIIPGGLVQNGMYYVVNVSGNTFKLSLTLGGAAIDITSQGSGTIALIGTAFSITIDTDTKFYESKKVTGTIYHSAGLASTRSPVDGTIEFHLTPSISFEFPFNDTVPAITDGQIGLSGHVVFQLEIASEETVPAIQDGRIGLNSDMVLEGGVYGLTKSAITYGEIFLQGPASFEVVIDTGSIVIGSVVPGTIYDLIENAIELPSSFEVEIIGQIQKTVWEITFVNALELEIAFDFLNSLNADLESSFSFKNFLTSKTIASCSFENRMLLMNEFEKNLTFLNRILTSESMVGTPEEYVGFYFSEIHGV